MPSQAVGGDCVKIVRAGNVYQDCYGHTVPGFRRTVERGLLHTLRGARLAPAARVSPATSAAFGTQHNAAARAINDGHAMPIERQRPEANHHRNAAVAGQHGDVAGRAAACEHDAAALRPVGFQKLAGRQILGCEDGARGQPLRSRAAAQAAVARDRAGQSDR